MKNYTTLILAGLVVVLAAVLIGVMVYIQNQPAEERAIQPLVEIAAMEPDSAKWGINYPNQYDSLMKTATNNIDTTYAGSSQFSWLERDPRQHRGKVGLSMYQVVVGGLVLGYIKIVVALRQTVVGLMVIAM